MSAINLRPHHGLCIQFFSGHGYNQRFTENMTRIVDILKSNPAQEIKLCATSDVLCMHCPHNMGSICEREKRVRRFDIECLNLSGFSIGQRLRWDVLQQAIYKNIIKKSRLPDVCGGCSWVLLCEKSAVIDFSHQVL